MRQRTGCLNRTHQRLATVRIARRGLDLHATDHAELAATGISCIALHGDRIAEVVHSRSKG
ncbi:MAG: hypothetical protein OXC93_16100 [Rhodospirillaceae bacterium]|nr:hypothetical protein [Rhodospirillaceae bacterium]